MRSTRQELDTESASSLVVQRVAQSGAKRRAQSTTASARLNGWECFSDVQVHFELKDAFFRTTVQRPPVLAHCETSRSYP